MYSRILLLTLGLVSFVAPAELCAADDQTTAKAVELNYDPAVSTLKGTLKRVKFEDDDMPALKGTSAWVLRLDKPVSLKASTDNTADAAETNVKDVQLVIDSKIAKEADLARFVAAKTPLVVSGKLFHGHTAHHVTRVLMTINALKPEEAAKKAPAKP
ncbi:DUF4431 domain-containing protein [Luteolibacter ambystomatis]|uniref:DUF4431 domain-containing protein n=1 Tax=Luteolibacter ambystomatis TaxID=2824561 RepID=A0A975G740_9BACT|nr:DUF4431 domain-containing protein [Luteolibacter ambystomatis]QUE50000.1 DUF4431 domain-containing protein [Luteolibacter ambystomatis]